MAFFYAVMKKFFMFIPFKNAYAEAEKDRRKKHPLMNFKYASLFLLLSAVSVSAIAQSAQIKAGVNFANISVTDNGSIDHSRQLTSFQIGIIGDLPLGTDLISFQPGILFSGKGSEVTSGTTSSSTYNRQTFNPKYIEIPANFLFKIPIGKSYRFFAGAGPYLGIGIAGKNKYTGRIAGIDYNGEKDIKFSNDDPATLGQDEGAGFGILRRFDYGANGTAGIEAKQVVLGINYGLGLAKLQSGSNSSANDNNKHRVLSFTVGFRF